MRSLTLSRCSPLEDEAVHTHVSFILQSACAVCINAGSLSDPSDIPGLAHLLEHSMVLKILHACTNKV